jgi:hypothetical protein
MINKKYINPYLLLYMSLRAAPLFYGIGSGLHGPALAGDRLAGHNLPLRQALILLQAKEDLALKFGYLKCITIIE